jgi:16S rRNA (guanine966-N2)-methyltransferase
MRIIAGSAKGRRLHGPRGRGTRPMTGKAREGLFSSLGSSVVGARVLDLYAGSGSLGLEALSRGADDAVFVERDGAALAALRANLDAVGLGGKVVSGDVSAYLEKATEQFDLAFVDPPYELSLPSVERILGTLEPRLVPGAVVVVHRRVGGGDIQPPPGLVEADRRRYGDAEITRLVKEAQR